MPSSDSCRTEAAKATSAMVAMVFGTIVLLHPFGGLADESLPYELGPVGDGTAFGLTVENPTIYPMRAQVGGRSGPTMAVEIPPYGSTDFLVQCDGMKKRGPRLQLTLDEASYEVAIPDLDFSDGIPALWISSARRGRAAIERNLQTVQPNLRLAHLALKEVPSQFAAMRFAPFILIGLSDFTRLADVQRSALTDAVRAGTTLVMSVADGPDQVDTLGAVVDVELGVTGPPDTALGHHLRRAFVQRRMKAKGQTRVLIEAQGQPVLVSARLGLGELRVLGVRLQDLEPGPIIEAILDAEESGLAGLFNDLRKKPAMGSIPNSPIQPTVWCFLLLLPLGLLVTRHRPAQFCVFVICWIAFGVYLSPNDQPAVLDQIDVLAVEAGEEMVLAGSAVLTAQRQGDLLLPAGVGPIAVERIYGQGGCLISGPRESAWLFKGEPGARLRASFLSIAKSEKTGEAADQKFQANGAGRLAHAVLEPFLKQPTLPFADQPTNLDAIHLRPASAGAEKTPLVLALPTPPATQLP